MRLPVNAKERTVIIDHSAAVVENVFIFFIKAYDKNSLKLRRNALKMLQSSIIIRALCKIIIFINPFLTKVLSFEELGQKDNVGSLARGFSYQPVSVIYIFFDVACAGHLDRSDFYLSHFPAPLGICWVIQCIFPPPLIISSAGTGIIFLCLHIFVIISTALLSLFSLTPPN